MDGYGTDQGFLAWLTAMGYALPDDGPTAEVLRLRGSDYLDATYAGKWTGKPVDPDQDRAWPRVGAKRGCTQDIVPDVIPNGIVTASYRAAWIEAQTPGTLDFSQAPGGRIAKQKVGPAERAFHDDGPAAAGSFGGYLDAGIDGLMQQFICVPDEAAGLGMWTLGSG